MRKPAVCIFLWPLYSDIIFFIDHYCAGVSKSIAYCLFFRFVLNFFKIMLCKNFICIVVLLHFLADLKCLGHLLKPKNKWLGMSTFIYRNDPKFSDRYPRANSADPDQTAPRGAV